MAIAISQCVLFSQVTSPLPCFCNERFVFGIGLFQCGFISELHTRKQRVCVTQTQGVADKHKCLFTQTQEQRAVTGCWISVNCTRACAFFDPRGKVLERETREEDVRYSCRVSVPSADTRYVTRVLFLECRTCVSPERHTVLVLPCSLFCFFLFERFGNVFTSNCAGRLSFVSLCFLSFSGSILLIVQFFSDTKKKNNSPLRQNRTAAD